MGGCFVQSENRTPNMVLVVVISIWESGRQIQDGANEPGFEFISVAYRGEAEMTVEEFLEKYTVGIRDFSGVDLAEANLNGAKLSEVILTHANLNVVNLSGAILNGANLRYAKLNVARLSGAHLSNADLKGASLNVANLIRADLSRAQMRKTSLIRAELIRANLSRADLHKANLRNADLREASLRQANLREANLSLACLKGGFLTGANLESANLANVDLTKSDLSGANLRDAELRQANLTRANLSGANLSGANLRWADLSGANLSWADLSGAKLSGANLSYANLSHANLTNTSLVHANLHQAKLIQADWVGADLSGATLTAAKLFATSRFGLKTEGIICEWVDLSPTGDGSLIKYFHIDEARDFFNAHPSLIRIIVDRPLDHEAHFAIAGAYYQISQKYPELKHPPTLDIDRRRTVFSFRVDNDEALFPTACIATLPWKDAAIAHQNSLRLLELLKSEDTANDGCIPFYRIQRITQAIENALINADNIKQMQNILTLVTKIPFFHAPTQIILSNSSAQTIILHEHPNFGQRLANRSDINESVFADTYHEAVKLTPFCVGTVVAFMKGFNYSS